MKIALVTGASGKIGSQTALLFGQKGYFVIAQYNNGEEGIAQLKTRFLEAGISDYLFCYKCDFSNSKEVIKMCENLDKSFKHIDALINNAGIDVYALLSDTSLEEWDKVFDVNVKSAFILTKWASSKMISSEKGKIVNVSSVWGISGGSMEVAYSTSKAALIGFTKALAKELAPSKINVNCVCPGVIDTNMNSRFSSTEMDKILSNIPLGRLGTAEEIARLIYFLCTEQASYITGQVITSDGGYIL